MAPRTFTLRHPLLVLFLCALPALGPSARAQDGNDPEKFVLRFRPSLDRPPRMRVLGQRHWIDRLSEVEERNEAEFLYEVEVRATDDEDLLEFLERWWPEGATEPTQNRTPWLLDRLRRPPGLRYGSWDTDVVKLPAFPEEGVGVGDEWTVDIPSTVGYWQGRIPLTVRFVFRLTRAFEEAGARFVEVEWKASGSATKGTLSGECGAEGRAVVSVADGLVHRKEYATHYSTRFTELERRDGQLVETVVWDFTLDRRYLVRAVE